MIRVRPATADDVTVLAQTNLIATRSHVEWGFLDVALLGPEERRLRYLELMAVAEPRCWNHYTNFLVAEADGLAGAGLCSLTMGSHIEADLGAAFVGVTAAMGITETEIEESNMRLAEGHIDYRPPDGCWLLEWAGTLPEHRRRGLMTALLEASLERGRDAGHETAELAVAIGNSGAQQIYERVGFEAYEDVRSADYERVMRIPGMRKMRVRL